MFLKWNGLKYMDNKCHTPKKATEKQKQKSQLQLTFTAE